MRTEHETRHEIEDVIDELAQSASNPTHRDWRSNSFGGADLNVDRSTGTVGSSSGLVDQFVVRLACEEEGYVDLFVFDSPRRMILEAKAHFDNVPAAVIATTVQATLKAYR